VARSNNGETEFQQRGGCRAFQGFKIAWLMHLALYLSQKESTGSAEAANDYAGNAA